MLKNRIITAVIFASLIFFGIVTAPRIVFGIVSGLIFLYAAWEWGCIIQMSIIPGRLLYIAFMAIIFTCCYWFITFNNEINHVILIISAFVWFFAAWIVFRYPKQYHWLQHQLPQAILGIFVITPSWLALNVLRASEHGKGWVLLLLFVICFADIGAYFVGKQFGNRKLMPKVSPKKTFAGLYGAIIFGIITAIIGGLFLHYQHWIQMLLLALISIIMSIVGDLFESVIKRQHDCKDSGSILPGHGGLLDRIDSITAAAPFFTLGVVWFGIN